MRSIALFIYLFLSVASCGLALAKTTPAVGLTAALEATVNNHPAVHGQLAELAAQGFRIDSAKSNRYPSLSGQLSTQDDGDEYASLRLSQPLWAFGKIDTPIAQQKALQQVELIGLLQVQRQLLERTAAAYANVQGIEEQLKVADENIIEHQNLYQGIERRQIGQLASEADVRIAFSRLIQAQSQRQRIVGELQVARAELRTLTQNDIDTSVAIEQMLLDLPPQPEIDRLARENHAEILLNQQQIRVAEYSVTLEKISSTPTLYAEATREFLDSTMADDTRVGLRFEGKLDGAGLGIIGRVKSAAAQVDAAQQNLRSTRNDVALRIDSLLANLAVQKRLKNSLQASVDAVRETKESYLRQYDSGRKTWLEVLNIQREFTEQRQQLVQADSNFQIFSLRIAALIGLLDATAGIENELANSRFTEKRR